MSEQQKPTPVAAEGFQYCYRPVFQLAEPPSTERQVGGSAPHGDRATGWEYVYTPEIVLHVNVAIATGRPLLVLGPPGSGKSSLARSIAVHQRWRYYQAVVTSHTQAQDLQWQFDALRRLSDAQLAAHDREAAIFVRQLYRYVEPRVLWWAFDRDSARRRGAPDGAEDAPAAHDMAEGIDAPESVILIDEIDKADPDVPNDLLVPLGSYEFKVDETGTEVSLPEGSRPPLLIITSNGERQLPNAFLRRWLTLELPQLDALRLEQIATRHFGADESGLYAAIAERTLAAVQDAIDRGVTPPGTAEFLDAVNACRTLGVQPSDGDPTWNMVRRTTLAKGHGGS